MSIRDEADALAQRVLPTSRIAYTRVAMTAELRAHTAGFRSADVAEQDPPRPIARVFLEHFGRDLALPAEVCAFLAQEFERLEETVRTIVELRQEVARVEARVAEILLPAVKKEIEAREPKPQPWVSMPPLTGDRLDPDPPNWRPEADLDQVATTATGPRPWLQYLRETPYAADETLSSSGGGIYEWLRAATEQNDLEAQCNLGVAYACGDGVGRDPREMVRWFSRAAEQGHARAAYNLGLAYSLGDGVPQDFRKAYILFDMAVLQGFERARERRDLFAASMTPEEMADTRRFAYMWSPRQAIRDGMLRG